jgi:hypothetical protein
LGAEEGEEWDWPVLQQVLFPAPSQPAFTAGISHIDGKYRFTQNNYLLEGAQKISTLGSNSAPLHLSDPSFRSDYPDESSTTGPASDPAGVDGLAQTGPYDQIFHLPFKTIVMTTLTFANADRVQGMAHSQDRLNAEENEFYQLTKYLYSRFSGSGKTFVLKNWRRTDSPPSWEVRPEIYPKMCGRSDCVAVSPPARGDSRPQ